MSIKDSTLNNIPLSVVGLSHHTSGVDIREKASLNDDEFEALIQKFSNAYEACGIMILSTCNRTEIYVSGNEAVQDISTICRWLDNLKAQKVFCNTPYTYTYTGLQAIQHFFRVISSLDSQLVGEPQITGQVKEAYEKSLDLNATNILINKMYNFGMQEERQVRGKTYLTDGAVSVSFAGVELARKIFGNLINTTVLLIGAGETAELAATHFIKRDAGNILVVNRTFKKAQILAEKFDGKPFEISDLPAALDQADIVISATSSKDYVVTEKMIKEVSKKRDYKPVFLIDLAIPRDVDPAAKNIDGVFLFNLDSLQEIVNANLERRQDEIPKAEKIINHYLTEYNKWFHALPVTDTITQLNRCFEEIREKEFERLKRRFPEDSRAEVEYLTKSLMKKFLHQHIRTLRHSNLDHSRQKQHIDLVSEIYQLNGSSLENDRQD
jgi:glutamyl-tRNA reductase